MKRKTKDPSMENAEPGTTDESSSVVDHPKENSDGHSDSMSADELAAFEKIMGEIEGQPEDETVGTAKGAGAENRGGQALAKNEPSGDAPGSDEPAEDLDAEQQAAFESIMAQIGDDGEGEGSDGQSREPETEDDFAAELERVAKEADAAGNEPSGDAPGSDEPAEDLDAEQQAAFESIMAQIGDDGEGEGSDGQFREPETEDDFAAELERVAKEADAAGNEPSGDTPGSDEPAEDLDAEQQAAFESIMAQIGDDGEGEGSDGQSREPETEDDFAAELERVAKEADAAGNEPSGDTPGSDEPAEDLDAEQQAAFENIMAQIEAGDPEKEDTDTENTVPVVPESGGIDAAQAEISSGLPGDGAGEGTTDIAGDIGDILKEATSGDNEPPAPETSGDEPVTDPVGDNAGERPAVDEGIVARKKKGSGPARQESAQSPPLVDRNENASGPGKKPTGGNRPDPRHGDKNPGPDTRQGAKKPKPLREAPKATGCRKKKIVMASVAVMLSLSITGYFYWAQQGTVPSNAPSPAAINNPAVEVVETVPSFDSKEPVAVDYGPSDESRLKTVAEDLDRLRSEMIEKKAEIEELRVYYQAGIDAEIRSVVHSIRGAGNGSISFKGAVSDPHIRLGLAAIQRRGTYIKKLENPVKSLFRNSEELLFFSRRAKLITMMSGKTSDIDIDGFMKQADEILAAHRSALENLNIDAVPASPPDLKSIWKKVEERLAATPVSGGNNFAAKGTDNIAIWKSICNGDFTQKHRLTELSPEAARCLAAWKGKDLFLNGLTELSSEVASELSGWNGEWLGLNGLNELTPEAAMHLSRWKGKGLSLNGLSRLSPKVVAILSEWQGDQIELVGVKYMAHWENPKTRLFLSEEMKRKRNTTRK